MAEMTERHASDCAVHNAPAFEPGPCDCAPMDKLVLPTGWPEGPWWVDADDRPGMEYNNHVLYDDGKIICFMAWSGNPDANEPHEKAAELIALAPTMAAEITALRAENARLREALEECREYFDDRADASIEPGDSYFVGNKEMTLLVVVDDALTPKA